jgi:hypothetical protein
MADKEYIEKKLAAIILDDEVAVAERNSQEQTNEYEAIIDMLECERSEKDYDWMSDIFIPEFPSHVLTQSSLDASQYFQTRDYVDVYLEDEGAESIAKSKAAKECINRTLNQKHLYYYQKYMRAKIDNNLGGFVYLRCWWEQEMEPILVTEKRMQTLDIDEFGEPITDTEIQVPARRVVEVRVPGEKIIKDRFNFDVVDRRNVFTDNTYCYSLQQKSYVTIRFERTLQQLNKDKLAMGYINLDKVKDMKPPDETETSKASYNKDDKDNKTQNKLSKNYDIYERTGDFWCLVKRNERDEIVEINPGIDEEGEPLDNAEFISVFITYAVSGSSRVLIRFQVNPYLDAIGIPFKPLIRGICYIHPSKDTGIGDGKYSRELQQGINDTVNLSNDRVRLATLPVMKGRKFAVEDNATIRFEPNHVIELEDPANDLTEVQISDDITGAITQIDMLTGKMRQVNSIYPTTMGDLPRQASTTATAVAGAETRSNTRANYKSLTFEHTCLVPLYWMILQMTWQFAKPETGVKLMGRKVYNFDADADYVYKPLSQSIEAEYSKTAQRKEITQLISFIAPIPNPKTPRLVNMLLVKMLELMGDEHSDIRGALLDENAPVASPAGTAPAAGGAAVSNQNQIPTSDLEATTRGATYA